MRYALLLASDGSAGGQQCLEILPASATVQDAGLQEGHFYGCKLASGVQLYWKQCPLSWLANPLASSLCGSHVCGDAILAVGLSALAEPCPTDRQICSLLSPLFAKASPRASVVLRSHSGDLEWEEASSGTGDSSAASLNRLPSSAPIPVPSSKPGSSRSSLAGADSTVQAPSTGSTQLAAGASGALPSPSPSASSHTIAAGSPSWLRSAVATPAGPWTVGMPPLLCGSVGDEFEPRQQLLWAIASRATSMSWAPTAPAAQQGGPAPATTAKPSSTPDTTMVGSHSWCSSTTGMEVELGEEASLAASTVGGDGDEASSGILPGDGMSDDEGHSQGWSPWTGARSEILALVISQAGYSSILALRMSQVCTGWRHGVHEERSMLRLLRFRGLRMLTSGAMRRAGSPVWLPWLVMEAARVGNVSAAIVAARHLESAPFPSASPTDAVWFWSRAAKKGHPEAQAKLGIAHYKGTLGLACDCEEAMLWLSRAAKQLTELVPASPTADPALAGAASGVAGGEDESSIAGESEDAVAPAALLMGAADCRRCLSQVSHILGLLHLDGEGTKMDLLASIKWLKVAERHGCMEAGLVLGSLYNTGQYG